MKGLLVAVGAAFRAFGGWLGRVLAALLRGVAASARVTGAGAKALGLKLAPAVKAGAAGAAGGVKRSIFALPGKILHTLRSKLVEVMITIALTAGVAYWISDAQVIRSEPIACWLSDKSNEWFGAAQPMAPGAGFRVLVAQLDGDDSGTLTRDVALSLQDVTGLEVRELCGSLGVPKGVPMAQGWRDAEVKARAWLTSWHADVILWGTPGPTNTSSVRLYVTTPTGSGGLKLYEMRQEEGYLLSTAFGQDFVAQVQASVLSGLEVNADGFPEKYSELLFERLPRLRALALARAGSATTNLSAATLYFVALQRVAFEDARRGRARVKLEDALPAFDGLAAGFDPSTEGSDWAGAMLTEATVKLLVYAPQDNVEGLIATAALFDRVAKTPNADPQVAPSALVGGAAAWEFVARIKESPDDMRRALSYLDEARRLNAGRASETFAATANNTFARVVQWLVRETGDASRLEEGVAAAEAALKAANRFDDDADGGWTNTTLQLADLQALLAGKRGDEGLLRQAIAAFDSVLTPETLKSWRAYYVMGLDRRLDALEALARATGQDADYARAVADAAEARSLITRQKNPGRYVKLSERFGRLMAERGAAANDARQVKAAIAGLKATLDSVSQESDLADWCGLKAAQARAMWSLAQIEKSDAGYDAAVQTMREAETAARRAGPQLQAQFRAERARMLSTLGFEREAPGLARESGDLYRAIMADPALKAQAPDLWAGYQIELGQSLMDAADMSRDAGTFGAAAAAFKAALSERTRERDLQAWFQVIVLQATALARQGEMTGSRAILEEAVALADEAKGVSLPASDPDILKAARVRAQAQTALALINKDAALAASVRAEMKAMLASIDRNALRGDWAWTRLRYGAASLVVGALSADAAATAEGVGAIIEARAVAETLDVKALVRAADTALEKAPAAHKPR